MKRTISLRNPMDLSCSSICLAQVIHLYAHIKINRSTATKLPPTHVLNDLRTRSSSSYHTVNFASFNGSFVPSNIERLMRLRLFRRYSKLLLSYLVTLPKSTLVPFLFCRDSWLTVCGSGDCLFLSLLKKSGLALAATIELVACICWLVTLIVHHHPCRSIVSFLL